MCWQLVVSKNIIFISLPAWPLYRKGRFPARGAFLFFSDRVFSSPLAELNITNGRVVRTKANLKTHPMHCMCINTAAAERLSGAGYVCWGTTLHVRGGARPSRAGVSLRIVSVVFSGPSEARSVCLSMRCAPWRAHVPPVCARC